MRLKDFSIREVSDAGDGGGITAYASTFDREPDSYGDVVAKGAFAESLAAWQEGGKPIPLLFGHQMDDPHMNIGAVTEAVEDDRGLKVTASFDPDSETAQYVRKLVNEGRISKLSFAFDVLDEGPVELEGGRKANELRRLDIFEVSLVTVPANGHAEVVESKARAKYGAAISKANGEELAAVRDQLKSISEAASAALETVAKLIPNNGDDADEGEPEDPDAGNGGAKSRELIAKLERLIKE